MKINDTIKNILVKNIILVNSANYAYFESKMDNSLILEGGNNEGKTSVLNTLQFLLLPEINLTNIVNKFRFKPGKDKKAFSSKETYEYYFSDENSFVIFEIENKNKRFCVLLYGNSKSKFEYRRIIIGTEFENLRKVFFNNDEITDYNRKEIFSKLKEYSDGEYKELHKVEDIKKYLFVDNRSSLYNIVPLKDTSTSTLENFKVLFKSLYDISAMDKSKKISLISDIIKSNQDKKSRKFINFNISLLENQFNELKKEKNQLDKLEYFKDDFEIIKNHFLNSNLEKDEIISDIMSFYKLLNDDLEELSKNINDNRYEKNDIKKNIESLEKNREIIKDEYETEKIQIKTLEEELEEVITNLNYINIDGKTIEEFINTNDIKSITNDVIPILENKIEEVKNNILKFKEQLTKEDTKHEIENDFKRLNEVKLELVKNIELYGNKLKDIEKIFENNKNFTEQEQKVIKGIFSHNIRTSNIDFNDNFFISIKSFLKNFDLKDDVIYYEDKKIEEGYTKEKSTIEILEEELRVMKFDLKNIEQDIENNEKILKKSNKNLKLEIEKEINNNEIAKRNLEKTIEIYYDFTSLKKKYLEIPNLLKKKIITSKELYIKKEKENEEIRKVLKEEKDINVILAKNESEVIVYNNTIESMESSDIITSFLNNERIDFYYSNFDDFKNIGDIVDIKTYDNKLSNNIFNYNNSNSKAYSILDLMKNKELLNDVNEEDRNNFRDDKNSYKKIINFLISEYNSLNERENYNTEQIKDLSEETTKSITLLKEITKDIKNFEKEINSNFNSIKISNLKGVEFKFKLNDKLVKLLNKFEDNIIDDLNYQDNIMEINNYLSNNSSVDKNEINIEDLIEEVEYKIIEKKAVYDKNNKMIEKPIYNDIPQSNGTETMIIIVFISLLLKGIYKSGHNLKMPIIIDEILNIDINNIKTLLDVMDKLDTVIIGACPEANADLRLVFNRVITIDANQTKYIRGKRKYIVMKDKNPLFETIKI